MKYDLKQIYDELSKIKDIKEAEEYKTEIGEIKNILSNFERQKALDECHKLINKYNVELNQIAIAYKNNKAVVPMSDSQKKDLDLVNDLIYMINVIPIIARIRETNKLITEILKNNN